MTMSWVAEKNVTQIAANRTPQMLLAGSCSPSNTMLAASPICVISNQLRRRPSARGLNRSTSGAQRNLMLYGSPTSPAMPIVARLTPFCDSQACSTVSVSMQRQAACKPHERREPEPRAEQHLPLVRADAHGFL